MGDLAIKVEGLGKKYKIGRKRSGDLRESFGQFIKTFKPNKQLNDLPAGEAGSTNQPTKEFWALKDINFEVKQGEAVGIIGRNGAGKSTLLKILSRITKPTTGRFEVNGRVSSLLEVGTGFHMELSGRENIYLNGTILGMKRREIKSKFDEIVAFSGVERFIDTPVKHYSSGMKVRLAFSVAAHLEPEILIIDEVLTVGDAEFQKKCLGKMEDVTGQGRTVLFVSHNMGAVKKLCTKGMILESGNMTLYSNSINKVVNQYLAINEFDHKLNWENENKLYYNEYFDLKNLTLLGKANEDGVLPNSRQIEIRMEINLKQNTEGLNFGFRLYNENQELVFFSFFKDTHPENWIKEKYGDFILKAEIPPRILNEGLYTLEFVSIVNNVGWIIKAGEGPVLRFRIFGGMSDSPLWVRKRDGLIAPCLDWKYEYKNQ